MGSDTLVELLSYIWGLILHQTNNPIADQPMSVSIGISQTKKNYLKREMRSIDLDSNKLKMKLEG